MQRIFLTWDKPFLPQAEEWLFARYNQGETWDMRGHAVVLPGSRALRRLTELLVLRAEKEKCRMVPPRMLTAGSLPELIAGIREESASDAERLFAWIEALRNFPPDSLEILIPGAPPSAEISAWMSIAENLDGINSEISGAGLTFDEIVRKIGNSSAYSDEERWGVLSHVHAAYDSVLSARGLKDKHMLRSEVLLLDEFHFSGDLILLSNPDLSRISRKLLKKMASPVFSLIHADESFGGSFDEFGCIDIDKWCAHELPLSESQFAIVERANDQVLRISARLAEIGSSRNLEEVSIGAVDQELVPYISETLLENGIPTRRASGREFRTSPLFVLLRSLHDFISLRSFKGFASFVRLPEVEAWLRSSFAEAGKETLASANYLEILDEYQSLRYQARMGSEVFGDDENAVLVSALYEGVKMLIGDMLEDEHTVQAWSQSLMSFLIRLYDGTSVLVEEVSLKAVEKVHAVAEEYFQLQPLSLPPLNGAQALSLFLRRLSTADIRTEPASDTLEILGWLELQLDDAPILFVTGFNEGRVPEALNSDPFLPDSVRTILGLTDNRTRYARDAFALCSMLHSKEELLLLGSRQSTGGERLLPSRLLYAAPEGDIVRRVLQIFERGKDDPAERQSPGSGSNKGFVFPIPPAKAPRPLASASVSAFGSYLKCPYRFYLAYVCGLSASDDEVLELDALDFGILAHEVLADFGKSSIAGSDNPAQIGEALDLFLQNRARLRFGSLALPAVLVQLEQLRERLMKFAEWQALWRAEGWEINDIERAFKGTEFVIRAGKDSLKVTGRIDRIDFNRQTGRYAVIDYKVGDTLRRPEQAHRQGGEWTDLQLPMYLYYLSRMGIPLDNMASGFVALCSDLDSIGFYEAGWSEGDLESAFECMRSVAAGITSQIYWPMSDLRSDFDAYSVLCGSDQFGSAG